MYLLCHTRFFPNFDSSSARSPHRGRIGQPSHVCAVVGWTVAPYLSKLDFTTTYTTVLRSFFSSVSTHLRHQDSMQIHGHGSFHTDLATVVWNLTLDGLGRRGMWPDVWISARSLAPWLW